MTEVKKVSEKDGKDIFLYTICSGENMRMQLTNYGATLVSLEVPDAQGKLADVVLGFDQVEDYFGDHPYLGATIGPYANRIAAGHFKVGEKEYQLCCNENGVNLLHSGPKGFDRVVWQGEPIENGVRFSYYGTDEAFGFPGKLEVTVEMTLADHRLRIEYWAQADADTLVNLTNHSYFNLHGSGTVENHVLSIAADHYTPVDQNLIPTGELAPVAKTVFDFNEKHEIGLFLNASEQQLEICGGYDHNFVLRGEGFRKVAQVEEPVSGRKMEVYTEKPGMQFYTANMLQNVTGKSGTPYGKRMAYCFETQLFPDSVHHENFPSALLPRGAVYHDKTEYRFSCI